MTCLFRVRQMTFRSGLALLKTCLVMSTGSIQSVSSNSAEQNESNSGTAPSLSQSAQVHSDSLLEDIVVVLTESVGEESTPQPNDSSEESSNQGQCQVKSTSIPSGSSLTLKQVRRWGYKNVCVLSLSTVIVFTSFVGLQNLQSSINSEGGLGLVSLSTLYVFFILSGFISPCALKIFGTKYSVLIGFLCHLLYTFSNYYPSWYTLIPSSAILGIASGPLWTAVNIYLVEVATKIAETLNKDRSELICKFIGIFFFFFQWSHIPGNLASSLIFFPYNQNQTGNVEGGADAGGNITATASCNIEGHTTIELKYLYILASVYVIFTLIGIVLLLVVVDKLPMSTSVPSGKKVNVYLKEPFVEVITLLRSRNMMLLAPIAIFNGLELAFSFGTFTEVYITECFGTYQVGFTLMVLGAISAIMSIVYGESMKYIPRFVIVLFAAALNISLILFLLIWERTPSYGVIFVYIIGWGVADAGWNIVNTTLIGLLYPNSSNSAYSVYRIWIGSGFAIGFITAELTSVEARLYILLGTIVPSVLCYIITELTTQTKASLLPCFYNNRCHKQNKSEKQDQDQTIDHHRPRQANNAVRTYECDSLDGTFPSLSTEFNIC